MSLKDGTKKMSKSDPSDLSRINLTDNNDEISIKIKKAKTDSHPLPDQKNALAKRPEAKNLIGIFSSLNNQDVDKTLNEFSGKNFSDLKIKLTELIIEKISPISLEIKKLKTDKNLIDEILNKGALKADEIASKKIKELKKIVGF